MLFLITTEGVSGDEAEVEMRRAQAWKDREHIWHKAIWHNIISDIDAKFMSYSDILNSTVPSWTNHYFEYFPFLMIFLNTTSPPASSLWLLASSSISPCDPIHGSSLSECPLSPSLIHGIPTRFLPRLFMWVIPEDYLREILKPLWKKLTIKKIREGTQVWYCKHSQIYIAGDVIHPRESPMLVTS